MLADVLFVAGFLVASVGLWWVSPSMCLLIDGLILMGLGWAGARREAKKRGDA